MANRLKQITIKAKQLYKTGKFAKWTDAIKAASKQTASVGATKKKAAKKVVKKKAAIKKAAPKKKTAVKKSATKKKATARNYGRDKDTNSHNVKVSVMSGTSQRLKDNALNRIKQYTKAIENYNNLIIKYQTIIKDKNTSTFSKRLYKKQIENLKNWINIDKDYIKELKKLI